MAIGFGGRIASGSSLGAYVRKITALEKVDKEDPRDAVLKYAKVSIVTKRNVDILFKLQVAEEDPYWVAPAYGK